MPPAEQEGPPSLPAAVFAQVVALQHEIAVGDFDEQALLELVVARACELTSADLALIGMPAGGRVVLRAAADAPAARAGRCLEALHALCSETLESGLTTFSDDCFADTRLDGEQCAQAGVGSVVCIALRCRLQVVGVVVVVRSMPRVLTAHHVQVLELLAGMTDTALGRARAELHLAADATSSAFERAELRARLRKALRNDELTGLLNREAWEDELSREMARARREGQALCVAVLDIDHLKRFNDQNGRVAGDRLLREVTSAWSGQLRATDVLARQVAGTFVLALPACPRDTAPGTMERLRAVVPRNVTCSIGWTIWDGRESSLELVARADSALFEAKRAGRDRVVSR